MPKTNYELIHSTMEGGREYTARELGVAPASMTAMVNRGLVEKIQGTPCRYKKIECSKYAQLCKMLMNYDEDYFTVWVEGEPLGMLCSFKNGNLYNCWDENWNGRIAAITKVLLFGEPNREQTL